jgi:hypothetical protein
VNDSKYFRQTGFVNTLVLIGLLILSVAIPVTTKLVEQNQENRSSAAIISTCKCSNTAYGDAYSCSKNGGKWTCVFSPTNTPTPTKTPTPTPKLTCGTNCSSCPDRSTCYSKTGCTWNSSGDYCYGIINTPTPTKTPTHFPTKTPTPTPKLTCSTNCSFCPDKSSCYSKTGCTWNSSGDYCYGTINTPTPTKALTITTCASKKGTCLLLGECKADDGNNIGKYNCQNNEICCVIVNKTPTVSSPTVTNKISCTSYVYSDWGECVNGTKSRKVTKLFPDGCTGQPTTTPLINTSCIPNPVACTGYIYKDYGPCINGIKTRSLDKYTPDDCSLTVGKPKNQPELTSICTPSCVTAGGTNCVRSDYECTNDKKGGIISNTSCSGANPTCCHYDTSPTGECVDTYNHAVKYRPGYSFCSLKDYGNYGENNYTGTNRLVTCSNGQFTELECENGCLRGVCLKNKDESCTQNFQCLSSNCGPEGKCLLASDNTRCQKNTDCNSDKCFYGLCIPNGSECDPRYKVSETQFLGCNKYQTCRKDIFGIYKCITVGVCGNASIKDGRKFPITRPPTKDDGLCSGGTPSTVNLIKGSGYTSKTYYSWNCQGTGTALTESIPCTADVSIDTNCDGQPAESTKCAGDIEYVYQCNTQGVWEKISCRDFLHPSKIGDETLCYSNKCQIINEQFLSQNNFCSDTIYNDSYSCKPPLVCDNVINQCTTNDKLTINSNNVKCTSIWYHGSLIYDPESACPQGMSCNRRLGICESISNSKIVPKSLAKGKLCEKDSDCISGFCGEVLPLDSRDNNYQVNRYCNEFDQKTAVDGMNSRLTATAAITLGAMFGPGVVAEVGSLLSSSYVYVTSALTTIATNHKVASYLISNGLTAGRHLLGIAACITDRSSALCEDYMQDNQIDFQNMLAAGVLDDVVPASVVDDLTDQVNNVSKIADSTTDATKLAVKTATETQSAAENIITPLTTSGQLMASQLDNSGIPVTVGGITYIRPSNYLDELKVKYGVENPSNEFLDYYDELRKNIYLTSPMKVSSFNNPSNLQKLWAFEGGVYGDEAITDLFSVERAYVQAKYDLLNPLAYQNEPTLLHEDLINSLTESDIEIISGNEAIKLYDSINGISHNYDEFNKTVGYVLGKNFGNKKVFITDYGLSHPDRIDSFLAHEGSVHLNQGPLLPERLEWEAYLYDSQFTSNYINGVSNITNITNNTNLTSLLSEMSSSIDIEYSDLSQLTKQITEPFYLNPEYTSINATYFMIHDVEKYMPSLP